MEECILTRPSEEYADRVSDYRDEFLACSSSMDGCGPLRRCETAEEWVRLCREYECPETVPEGHVPATQFLFVRKSDGRLIGMLQIRHSLNDYLRKFAGHIGYSVRPTERRKGYAKKMLAAALPLCREIGLDRVMISCIDGNIASEKTILANGGVYTSSAFDEKLGRNLKQFWITL